eukprot:1425834-Alexandrium_andersonii.AAC.1
MSASLVGSEMCIRDSLLAEVRGRGRERHLSRRHRLGGAGLGLGTGLRTCLLYTSDAADDM